MKRLILALVLACVLVPATARANSGTIWDVIYGLDPKLTGISTAFHIACLTADGKLVDNCEEFWGARRASALKIDDVKHEFDFRLGYYWEYGESYENFNAESIHAWKFMGTYNYRADRHISVGLGGGVMPFYGKAPDGVPFDSFTRVILTPLSITYAPATTGGKWKKSFLLRGEATFFRGGFSPGDFDNRLPKTETKGEWNFTIGAGFDLRRRFIGQ
jgi:hypothetical protein